VEKKHMETAQNYEDIEDVVPAAVLRQAKEADRIMLERTGQAPAPEPPVADPPAADPDGQQGQTATEPDATAPTGDQAAQSSQVDPKDDKTANVTEETWEHRFKVMEGKYKAEVPRYAKQVTDLQERILFLEKQLTDLSRKPADQTQVKQGKYKPEDYREYGAEIEDLAKSNQDLTQTVDRLNKRIEELSGKQGYSDFQKKLAIELPDWEAQNRDKEGFIPWLSGIDPVSGTTYRTLLLNAESVGDAKRVATIFRLYRKESGNQYTQANEPQPPAVHQETPRHQIPKPTVAPPRSRAGDDPTAASKGDKKIWTGDEISKFYRDVSQGKYTDQEAAKLEKDIFQAKREGRIR
jgi:Skp family chaperone for outer membrane proteins